MLCSQNRHMWKILSIECMATPIYVSNISDHMKHGSWLGYFFFKCIFFEWHLNEQWFNGSRAIGIWNNIKLACDEVKCWDCKNFIKRSLGFVKAFIQNCRMGANYSKCLELQLLWIIALTDKPAQGWIIITLRRERFSEK